MSFMHSSSIVYCWIGFSSFCCVAVVVSSLSSDGKLFPLYFHIFFFCIIRSSRIFQAHVQQPNELHFIDINDVDSFLLAQVKKQFRITWKFEVGTNLQEIHKKIDYGILWCWGVKNVRNHYHNLRDGSVFMCLCVYYRRCRHINFFAISFSRLSFSFRSTATRTHVSID